MANVRNLLARAFRKAAFVVEPPQQPIDAGDLYTKWLCFANAGMLDPGNLYLIDYALGRIKTHSPMIEIGSFCGLSANVLTHFKRKYRLKNRLITCDKWDFENHDADRERVAGSPVLFTEYRQFVRDSYLRSTGVFSADDLPYTVEVLSDEFFDTWKKGETVEDVRGRTLQLGGPISLAYIDGNHTYEGAKQDFLNCDAFLEPGGFLLFDDSAEHEFGVWRLMPEVHATDRYQLVATNPNHLFQKMG